MPLLRSLNPLFEWFYKYAAPTVLTELRKAREVEKKEKRRKLFPIRLTDFETLRDWTCFDADTGKDLAVEVREYFIPDFPEWKKPTPGRTSSGLQPPSPQCGEGISFGGRFPGVGAGAPTPGWLP